MFAGLLLFEWLAGMALAEWISPRTWGGLASEVHPHVYAAVFVGAAVVSFPIFMVLTRQAAAST